VTELTFLGTGNFLSPPGRYWNSFVMDSRVLVEPSPIALPHLRRCGLTVDDIEVVVVSHFHADHCFGWPFLLQAFAEAAAEADRGRTVHVVGPAGIEEHLVGLCDAGAVRTVHEMASDRVDFVYLEADGTWQEAGGLRFRAVEVDHVPYLRCFGYLFERPGQVVGYSGDTTPCEGLHELADAADVLVVECNGRHTPPGVRSSHMDEGSIRVLHAAHPGCRLVLTHLGEQVDLAAVPGTIVPGDFERLTV